MEAGDLQAAKAAVAVYVALELSRSSWLVALQGPGARRPSRHKLDPGDAKRLVALIAQAKRAAKRAGQAVRVVSCYEAGYEGFWLHRVLLAAGVESHIVNASSLLVDRRARQRKTDRIDVEKILRELIAWDRGDHDRCSMVVAPDVDAEDARRLNRERGRLVSERTAHINRIKGLLMTQGIYHFQPTAPEARAELDRLITGDGRPLPTRQAAEIARELDRLDFLQAQIAVVERQRITPRHKPTDLDDPGRRILQLQQLRGIGPEIATVLQNEVFYRRFDNRRQIAAYCGLDGSPWRSGRVSHEQGISKAGNRRARHALVELAWLWLQHQPQTDLATWFHTRVGKAKGRLRKITIVALARRLVIALWHFLEHSVLPNGALASPQR